MIVWFQVHAAVTQNILVPSQNLVKLEKIAETQKYNPHVNCHLSNVISQMSAVICHLSTVNCHMSNINCEMSDVICHVSIVTCHISTDTSQMFSITCQLSLCFMFEVIHNPSWTCTITTQDQSPKKYKYFMNPVLVFYANKSRSTNQNTQTF